MLSSFARITPISALLFAPFLNVAVDHDKETFRTTEIPVRSSSHKLDRDFDDTALDNLTKDYYPHSPPLFRPL